MYTIKPHTSRGFTLIEAALSLLIVSLLFGGMIKLMSAQNLAREQTRVQSDLQTIKESLLAYAALHGRLPCPANADGLDETRVAAGWRTCGVRNVGRPSDWLGGGNLADENWQRRVVVGYLPHKSLDVPQKDQYGNPYIYVVTLHYADFESLSNANGRYRDPTPFPTQQVSARIDRERYEERNKQQQYVRQRYTRCENALPRKSTEAEHVRPTFTHCSKGGIRLVENQLNRPNDKVLYNDMVFAVISLGENGVDISSGSSESQNIKMDSNGRFVNTNGANRQNLNNRTIVIKDNTNTGFDDQVIWASPYEMANILLEADLLP